MSKGRTNKNKGNDAERYFANEFKTLGYTKCITTRNGSKLYDDCGIDLMFIPFLVQIKAGYARQGLNIKAVLDNISTKVSESFPEDAPEQKMPRLLLWKKDVGRGMQKTSNHILTYMYIDEFVHFFSSSITAETLLIIQVLIHDTICITFDDFKRLLTLKNSSK